MVDKVYAQEKTIDEYLEWPSETNYNLVFISIVIMIALAIIANYFWSKRKGRRFSAE